MCNPVLLYKSILQQIFIGILFLLRGMPACNGGDKFLCGKWVLFRWTDIPLWLLLPAGKKKQIDLPLPSAKKCPAFS